MQKKNIIIFGASGHGSVILDCIEKEGKYNVIGFLDSFKERGSIHCGYPVLGSEDDLPLILSNKNIFAGVIAIGDNWQRKLMLDKIILISPEFQFINVIHPNAIIGKDVVIGQGTVIMAGVIVNSSSIIKNHCILNTNSLLEHDCVMENFSSLSPGVNTSGNVLLGKGSAICIAATIVEGVVIGNHTIVGAASLVIDNLPNEVLAYGSPAKVIRKRKIGDSYLGKKNRISSQLYRKRNIKKTIA